VHLTARPACCSFRSYSRMWFLMRHAARKETRFARRRHQHALAALAAVGRAQAEWGAVAFAHVGHRELPRAAVSLVLEIMEYCAAGGIAAV